MLGKRGKLSGILFAFVVILPLVGLLIMDYQVKRANDITGAYLYSGTMAYVSENVVYGMVVVCAVVVLGFVFAIGHLRKSRLISTMPLAKINDEIKKIDERLKL